MLGYRGAIVFVSFRNRIRRRYQSIPKRTSRVVLILGIVLFFTSLMLIPSSVLASIMNENMWPFIVPMAVGLVLSVIMVLKFSLPTDMRPADGLMMMFSVWMLLFAFGTIPYLISGFTLDNAIFESISGFTTTGATIITDVTSQSHSLLLWRAITNWIGGIIIVMMFSPHIDILRVILLIPCLQIRMRLHIYQIFLSLVCVLWLYLLATYLDHYILKLLDDHFYYLHAVLYSFFALMKL